MAEDALTFVAQNAQIMVAEQYHLVSGAENEVNLLVAEGRLVSAFLKELENQPIKKDLLKQYGIEVRDVAYKAHDIIDECLTRAALEKSMKFLRFVSPKYTSLAYQVRTFRQDTIEPLFLRYGIGRITSLSQMIPPSIATNPNTGEENIVGNGSQANSPTKFLNGEFKHQIRLWKDEGLTSPEGEASTSTKFENEELKHEASPRRGTVVGFKEEADTIVKFLLEESKQLEVISIIGMPGKGKTTLARKVMRDGRVANEFRKLIWVDISQSYEKRKVYLSILKSLTQDKDMSNLADDVLASTIRVYLLNLKFLLILDDVWINAWDDIEAALPKANKLGKVLITSRHGSVGVKANWTREPYQLGILDESTSWKLLQLQVFDNLDVCPPDLVPIGKKIATGCGGVPLAIVVIGGTLLKICSASTGFNEIRVWWEKVSNNVSKYYYNDDESRTRNVIALSCSQLSGEVIKCFLYLGTFPEDYQIPISRLIQLWIGEDFIGRQPNMSSEEVAYSYLKDLIDRNLVMVDSVKYDGYIKTCRVPGLIREFCKDEASFENQNLFQEVEMSTSDGTFDPPVSEIQSRRRISIHSHVEDFLQRQPEGPRVHSFLCFAKDTVTSLAADTSPIPMQFTRLRVLDMNPVKLTRFPSKISELIHLRYISLSGDGRDFKVVPKAISKLWNLKTLTIETKLPTIEVKANIWKMIHLRHVKSKAAIVLHNKTKGRGGEQLQSFSRLSTKCCTKGVFNKAKNLKNLGIRGDLADILEVDCFRELHRLQKFKLVHNVPFGKPLPRLPNHDRFPPNVRTLQISGTYLPWNQIRALGNLPALQVLILKSNAFTGKYWLAVNGCFATLEILVIEDTNLEIWTCNGSYFPKLRCLVLKDCKELKQIPLQLMENLERLHLERVCDSAVEVAEEKHRARRGGFELIIDSGGKSWR